MGPLIRSTALLIVITGHQETLLPPETPRDASLAVLNVWLGDQAGASPDLLRETRLVVSEIYRAIRVSVVWADDPAGSSRPLIAIVAPDDRAHKLAVRDPRALGVTLRTHTTGGRVYGFLGRVERTAAAHRLETARLLGAVLAHELAHALLPEGSHSQLGIMRPAWDAQQLRVISAGQALFSPREATMILQQLR